MRHGEAERLRGLEIDHKLKTRCLHDRQVGRRSALQNTPDIVSKLSADFGAARAVAHQPAGGDEFTPFVKRRNLVTSCEGDDLVSNGLKQCGGAIEKSGYATFGQHRECLLDFLFVAGSQHQNRLSKRLRGSLHLLGLQRRRRRLWVHQKSDQARSWEEFAQ